jgi:carbon storage regulator
MLVLARGPGQSLVLDERIVVTVLEAGRGVVRLGIEAPTDVGVRRGELGPTPLDVTAGPLATSAADPDHAG